MRALIFELRPGNLEHDGLVQALRTHAAGIEGRTGLPVTVEADAIDRLEPSHENALFRIAQEAVHNVVKHASARSIRIRLDRHDSWVRLAVHDDGTGFDPARIPAGHVGLAGMRTRAEGLGGRFHVDSAPGAGTRIEVQLPYVARYDGTPASAG
jgi:signal transduction histidine kinase